MRRESAEDGTQFSPETQVTIARERENVTALQADLISRTGSSFTAATVSARVPNEDLFVITPATVALSPEGVILADFGAVAVAHTPGWDGEPSPSTAEHARAYRDDAGVGGVADLAAAGRPRVFEVGPDAGAAVAAVLAKAVPTTQDVPGTHPGEHHN